MYIIPLPLPLLLLLVLLPRNCWLSLFAKSRLVIALRKEPFGHRSSQRAAAAAADDDCLMMTV